MGRRRPVEEEETELWLLSYADMMTLIACFFILLIAFANFDPVGFQEKVEVVSKHFRKEKYKTSEIKLKVLLEEIVKHPELKEMTKVSIKDSTLVITFSGSVLFDTNTAVINPDVISTLDNMIEIIKGFDPNYRILVEGHTDNQPPPPELGFINNWAFGAARAAAVIERFEVQGFDPLRLTAISKADTRPIEPFFDDEGNLIEENLKLNRRVVLRVIQPLAEGKTMKLGLGVYFDDATQDVSDVP